MDLTLYFQILLGQWQGVILEIPIGCFRVFRPFLPNKQCQGGFSSDLKMDPLNLYPTMTLIVMLVVLDTFNVITPLIRVPQNG